MRAFTPYVILACMLAGCSGGGDPSPPAASSVLNPGGSTATPPPERIVYLADQDIDEVFELYLAGSATKLNPPLPPGKRVVDFAITPDRNAVVYRADQDTDDIIELYRVEFANPGVSTKLNSPLPPGGDVNAFLMTADHASVLYVADQAADEVHELYRVAFASPGSSTKLNGPLVPGGNVFFDIIEMPDGSGVLYRATQNSANLIELYRVPFSTPGLSTKLNAPLPSDGDVASFRILPNNTAVVYALSRQVPVTIQPSGLTVSDFQQEIYLASFSTAGTSTKLNGPLGGFDAHYVGQYDIRPDNAGVVYTTASTSGDYRVLQWVPFSTPGVNTRLNGTGDDAYLSFFEITPDGSTVVYAANQQPPVLSHSGTQLYAVSFSSPGTHTTLNGPLAAGGGIPPFSTAFHLAPIGRQVVYLGNEVGAGGSGLYTVTLGNPGVSTRLTNTAYPFDHNFSINSDGSAVIYRATDTASGSLDLYRVSFSTPGVSTKLNGPLTAGGNVDNFKVQ